MLVASPKGRRQTPCFFTVQSKTLPHITLPKDFRLISYALRLNKLGCRTCSHRLSSTGIQPPVSFQDATPYSVASRPSLFCRTLWITFRLRPLRAKYVPSSLACISALISTCTDTLPLVELPQPSVPEQRVPSLLFHQIT